MLRQEINSFQLKRQRKEILASASRIAVVGLRPDPIYKSYTSTQKLIDDGFEIAPVISNCESILGLTRYRSVLEIAGPIDIVQFYTDGKADMMQAAQEAIQKGAKAFWIENDEATDDVRLALKAGNVCLIEYESLQKEYAQSRVDPPPLPAALQAAPARHVGDNMTRYPVTVTPDASLQSALEKMERGHFRHLPVVDEHNRLLGMCSDRDLRLIRPSPSLETNDHATEQFCATPVVAAAAANPISVAPDATLEEAAKLMLQWRIEALPVVAGDDHVIGIITSSDFLKERVAHSEPKRKGY